MSFLLGFSYYTNHMAALDFLADLPAPPRWRDALYYCQRPCSPKRSPETKYAVGFGGVWCIYDRGGRVYLTFRKIGKLRKLTQKDTRRRA